ncbi:hypothetical protein [Salinibacterium sp.]|uniref:hypothetical protein n=1 Tax=Salinibacterium sp. TaxID=1915057 RepID=UPI00286B00E5|nr:hypothetical protein [Salinibacterium sp.]
MNLSNAQRLLHRADSPIYVSPEIGPWWFLGNVGQSLREDRVEHAQGLVRQHLARSFIANRAGADATQMLTAPWT